MPVAPRDEASTMSRARPKALSAWSVPNHTWSETLNRPSSLQVVWATEWLIFNLEYPSLSRSHLCSQYRALRQPWWLSVLEYSSTAKEDQVAPPRNSLRLNRPAARILLTIARTLSHSCTMSSVASVKLTSQSCLAPVAEAACSRWFWNTPSQISSQRCHSHVV